MTLDHECDEKHSFYSAKALDDCHMMVLNRKAFKHVEERIKKK